MTHIAVIFIVKNNVKGRYTLMAKRGENIYKRKDGRWEARVIKGYDTQGKALYAYFYGRTYKEAKDKIFMSLPCISSDSTTAPTAAQNTPQLKHLLDSWLEGKEVRLKKSSYAKYFNLISNHIKPSLGHYALTDITGVVLNSYIAEKLKTGKKDASGGLSEKTVKDIITIIKSVLRFAKDEGLLSDVIYVSLTLPRDKQKEMRVLTVPRHANIGVNDTVKVMI